jgi:toxin-antitoxin system PIN domain toxin
VIAFDTNILVYAHRRESTFHARARDCVREASEGTESWAIPWPCLHEFLAIVTSPRIFKTPTPTPKAVDQIDAWLASPTLRLLAEEAGYLEILRRLLAEGRVSGAKIHDARVAALALFHDVSELLTADRDFSRFPSLTTRNPL